MEFDSKHKYVIENYLNEKPFFSFLPSVAGMHGKPVWAFYCNRGQGMCGFGTDDKNHPIAEFCSATYALQRVPLTGFRTFYKKDGKTQELFTSRKNSHSMSIYHYGYSIKETLPDGLEAQVAFNVLPEEEVPALMRYVRLKNTTDREVEFELADGLPVIFPYGMTNSEYKEMANLMRSWSKVFNLENKAALFRQKASSADESEVSEVKCGNFCVAYDENGLLPLIVDPEIIFDDDQSFRECRNFSDYDVKDLLAREQITENIMPCAFTIQKRKLAAGETYELFYLLGRTDDVSQLNRLLPKIVSPHFFEQKWQRTIDILEELVSCVETHTNNIKFDEYVRQCCLDNNLRGGFPVKCAQGLYAYLYSRKHGDMERDYNFFRIPAEYYSVGEGNFRDVNQNRRNDIFFCPEIGDESIRLFYSLIQADGFNPLIVRETLYSYEGDEKIPDSLQLDGYARGKQFTVSELMQFLHDREKTASEVSLQEFIAGCKPRFNASFGEGYWSDHWTYNLDLVDSYLSVFPDRREELLHSKIGYFYTPYYVEDRKHRHCLTKNGKVRQLYSIPYKKTEEECRIKGISPQSADWLKTKNRQIVTCTVLEKMVHLAVIKFSMLDIRGWGIEMIGGRPGWNDALNGLPALFGSGMSETVELLRLVEFLLDVVKNKEPLCFFHEQAAFIDEVAKSLKQCDRGYDLWNALNTAREDFTAKCRGGIVGPEETISVDHILELLKEMRRFLEESIQSALLSNGGILPSFLTYRVTQYQKTGEISPDGHEYVEVLGMECAPLVNFLEANARLIKLGKTYAGDRLIEKIKQSGMYDKKLRLYKVSESLEQESPEIGRIRSFAPGWQERESCFLHMTYKYLLAILKSGHYEKFFEEARDNLVCNFDFHRYGRSVYENSSFIITDGYPDRKKNGQGNSARLTGANSEFLSMWTFMMFGGKPFTIAENGELQCEFKPVLRGDMFDENGELSFRFLNKVTVTYRNPERLDTFAPGVKITRIMLSDGSMYDGVLTGKVAEKFRSGVYPTAEMTIGV